MPHKTLFRRFIAAGTLFAFLASFWVLPPASAQELYLPAPGQMVPLSPAFSPIVLKGIKLDPKEPFQFHFYVDAGNGLKPFPTDLKSESEKLIKYFLASLTIPEEDLWVNLSPYEKNRIVPQEFGQTQMGRDLLAQDYLLKQITASLIYPEGETGRKFWKEVYAQAQAKYGTTNIPVNTFNKVWIVPEKAVVYENAGTAFVLENHLKVMLEEDYLSTQKHNVGAGFTPAQDRDGVKPSPTVNGLGSQIIRTIVIPKLEQEVNQGANFAQLRQVFYSLILATWYKKKIKDSILAKVYADKNKTEGIRISDQRSLPDRQAGVISGQEKLNTDHQSGDEDARPLTTDRIYQQYLSAFKKGVFNYIKDEADPISSQAAPRKYFSGGVIGRNIDAAMLYTANALTASEALQGSKLTELIGNMELVNRKASRNDLAMSANAAPEFSQGGVRVEGKRSLSTAELGTDRVHFEVNGDSSFWLTQKDGVVKGNYYGDFMVYHAKDIIDRIKQRGGPLHRILDLGAGKGSMIIAFGLNTESNVQLLAIDNNPKAIDLTRQNAQENHINDRLTLLHRDVEDEWVSDGEVDLITFDLPLIPVDPEKYRDQMESPTIKIINGGSNGRKYIDMVIRRASRALSQAGSVVFSQPDFDNVKQTMAMLEKYGFEAKVIAKRKKLLKETAFTAENKGYIASANNYLFQKDEQGSEYFEIVIIEAIKRKSKPELNIQNESQDEKKHVSTATIPANNFQFGDRRLVINHSRGVFNYSYYLDFLVRQLPDVIAILKARGNSLNHVLELGRHRGILLLGMGLSTNEKTRLSGSYVTPETVPWVQEHVKANHLESRVDNIWHSHLYRSIPSEAKFDLIIHNLSDIPIDQEKYRNRLNDPEIMRISGGPDGRQNANEAIDGAADHLNVGGALVFVQPDFIGIEETLQRLEKKGLKASVLYRQRKKLKDTIFTYENRAYIESLGYKFIEDKGEPYFEMVIIMGEKASSDGAMNSSTLSPEEYFKYFMEYNWWFLSGRSEEEQKILNSSGQWFGKLEPSKRNELFLFFAKRFDDFKDEDIWSSEYEWFEALSYAAMGWIREGLIDVKTLIETSNQFEAPALRRSNAVRSEVIALHLAIGFKACQSLSSNSAVAKKIISSIRASLETCQVRDLRGAFDLLHSYFNIEWIPFVQSIANNNWPAESLELWQQEMGLKKRVSKNINPNTPIYFSLPYLSDGRGDVVIAWSLLLKLRERYPSNPIFFIAEEGVVSNWMRSIEEDIQTKSADQILKGIRILTYKTTHKNFSTSVAEKAAELGKIKDHIATSKGYVLIKHLPTAWQPKAAALERTLNIADFDNGNYGRTFGSLYHDFFATGFIPGTLGVGVNGSAIVKPALTSSDRLNLLNALKIAEGRLASMKWAVAYLHSLKGLENYIQNLIDSKIAKPIVLFDLGAGQRGYSDSFPAKPYELPGVQVVENGDKQISINEDTKVLVVRFWGDLATPLFQKLLVSSDVAPKIRGAGTMSFLFKQHKPFLIERELTFLDDSFEALNRRAQALGKDLWQDELAFKEPSEFNAHNAAVLEAIETSQPWDMADRLSVYTDHLLKGNDMPMMKRKIRHHLLVAIRDIVSGKQNRVESNLKKSREEIVEALKAYPKEFKTLRDELQNDGVFYLNTLEWELRDGVINLLNDILKAPERYIDNPNLLDVAMSSQAEDRAALSRIKRIEADTNIQRNGGIDLNPAQMSLNTQKEGEDFKFEFNGVQIDTAQITGATFTIRDMVPVSDIQAVLGFPATSISPKPFSKR